MTDEQKLVELTRMLDAKVKLSNDQYDQIADLTRKSDMDQEEIAFLKSEIDKERRKSNADEATIKKLEYLMAEKLKMIDESKARETSLESEIRKMRDLIDQERNKSMVDEANERLSKAQETFVNEPGPVDDAAKLLADMVAMGGEIGLGAD